MPVRSKQKKLPQSFLRSQIFFYVLKSGFLHKISNLWKSVLKKQKMTPESKLLVS